jgi:ComF family protein
VRALIADFKFRQRLHLGRLFGQLLAEAAVWQSGHSLPELLIPVPLHSKRLRERGYNQSLEVARVIGRELKIPVDSRVVERAWATPPQLSLAREERLANVRDAFRVPRPLQARHVAIIDDVVTTGATAGELAGVLHQAGAERVDVWAIARTP